MEGLDLGRFHPLIELDEGQVAVGIPGVGLDAKSQTTRGPGLDGVRLTSRIKGRQTRTEGGWSRPGGRRQTIAVHRTRGDRTKGGRVVEARGSARLDAKGDAVRAVDVGLNLSVREGIIREKIVGSASDAMIRCQQPHGCDQSA